MVGILTSIEKVLAIDLAVPQMISSRRSFLMNAVISFIIFVQSPD